MKRKVFARGPPTKNSPHNAPPDSSRFAKKPPALYHTASICSRGFSGGARRHCPPVPAILNLFIQSFPPDLRRVKLKILNDTNLYPVRSPAIRCPPSWNSTCTTIATRKLRTEKRITPPISSNSTFPNFLMNSSKVRSVVSMMNRVEIPKPSAAPIMSDPIIFKTCFIMVQIYVKIQQVLFVMPLFVAVGFC